MDKLKYNISHINFNFLSEGFDIDNKKLLSGIIQTCYIIPYHKGTLYIYGYEDYSDNNIISEYIDAHIKYNSDTLEQVIISSDDIYSYEEWFVNNVDESNISYELWIRQTKFPYFIIEKEPSKKYLESISLRLKSISSIYNLKNISYDYIKHIINHFDTITDEFSAQKEGDIDVDEFISLVRSGFIFISSNRFFKIKIKKLEINLYETISLYFSSPYFIILFTSIQKELQAKRENRISSLIEAYNISQMIDELGNDKSIIMFLNRSTMIATIKFLSYMITNKRQYRIIGKSLDDIEYGLEEKNKIVFPIINLFPLTISEKYFVPTRMLSGPVSTVSLRLHNDKNMLLLCDIHHSKENQCLFVEKGSTLAEYVSSYDTIRIISSESPNAMIDFFLETSDIFSERYKSKYYEGDPMISLRVNFSECFLNEYRKGSRSESRNLYPHCAENLWYHSVDSRYFGNDIDTKNINLFNISSIIYRIQKKDTKINFTIDQLVDYLSTIYIMTRKELRDHIIDTVDQLMKEIDLSITQKDIDLKIAKNFYEFFLSNPDGASKLINMLVGWIMIERNDIYKVLRGKELDVSIFSCIVDFYTICRLEKEYKREQFGFPNKIQNVIYYAGGWHISNILDYYINYSDKDVESLDISGESIISMRDDYSDYNVNRCIDLNSNLKEFWK